MPGSLQNKLQQFEVVPPPAVWDKISRQLDEEFVASDIQLSAKLADATIAAPSAAWNKISSEINEVRPAEYTPAKVVPLYKKIAVAAIILGALIMAGLYFLNTNKPANEIVKTVDKKTTPSADAGQQQAKQPDTGSNALIAANEKTVPKLSKENNRPLPKPRIVAEHQPLSTPIDYTANPEQSPIYDLQTVSALQPVSVSAPPLRDKKGNIIMDASLISNPHDEYITVTGPNGKQTKISSKFLSCLSYINGNLTSIDGDIRGIQCKTQFEEWRRKILAQPAFIPTANNFFDIFELKDLLQEM